LQPLDYYEVTFITPISSLMLFTFIGLVLSFSLTLALRGRPSNLRGVIYVIIACLFSSSLFSFLFSLHALLLLVLEYVTYALQIGGADAVEDAMPRVLMSFMQMGDFTLQVLVDAALMTVSCVAAQLITVLAMKSAGDRSLRTTFRVWLFVAVAVVFMVTTAVCFVVITEQSKNEAASDMDSEVDYLDNQLKAYTARMKAVEDYLARNGKTAGDGNEADIRDLEAVTSIDNLLNGYTKSSDGSVAIFKDGVVILSDDETMEVGATWNDLFATGLTEMDDLVDSGKMHQVAYDDDANTVADQLEDSDFFEYDKLTAEERREIEHSFSHSTTTQMAFMRLARSGDYVIMVLKPDTMVFASRTSVMTWTSLSTIVLLLAVFLMASLLLTRVVVNRIDETNGVLAKITDGNLNARVRIRNSREFKSLSTGINVMVATLRQWIAEAESRMDQELSTAKAIQESALPRTFPPFPDIRRFDIYASMNAAREVGGDFYDFFIIGDDSDSQAGKLGFVVADVSGKGVPAALFMMAAKTEVRNYLESGVSPGEAVENANRQLCDGNDAGMFVTLFAGVLDYATGHVSYVNAGHNPPLLWQAGSWRWLRDVSGMPLGLFDGFPYDTYEIDLQIGDEFFIYSDGVTEAMNVNGELFSEERLQKVLEDNFTLHPCNLIEAVSVELRRYAYGAEQSDDITMLSLEYGVPPELTASLTVAADVDELPRVNDFIHAELDRRLCPVKVQNQLDIALEELFVNVAHYAYPNATPENPGRVRVSYTYTADPPAVLVELVDRGVPYNPLAKPDAVTPDDIVDVPIGGLGILMAKKSVDDMTYEYRDGMNVVAFSKKW